MGKKNLHVSDPGGPVGRGQVAIDRVSPDELSARRWIFHLDGDLFKLKLRDYFELTRESRRHGWKVVECINAGGWRSTRTGKDMSQAPLPDDVQRDVQVAVATRLEVVRG